MAYVRLYYVLLRCFHTAQVRLEIVRLG